MKAFRMILTLTMLSLLGSGFAQTKLTMTVWGGKGDVDTYTERLEAAMAQYPDIEVQLIHIPTDYDQKVQTMVAGGTPPDIMMFAEQIDVYASKGMLLPLDDLLAEKGVNLDERYDPALLEQYRNEEQLYALPDRAGAMVNYYNKALFDEAGLEYPSADWTWDDVLSAAQQLTLRDEGGKVTQWGMAIGNWWAHWLPFVIQNGGTILDENGEPNFDTPETREAIQFIHDLIYVHKVAPSPKDYADMGDIGGDQLLAQGELAFEPTGFWLIGTLAAVEGLQWDIAPLWQGEVQAGTVPFGSGLAVSSGSQNPEAAFQIIEFLTSTEGQGPILANGEDVPANRTLLESDAFLNPEFLSEPIDMAAFRESTIVAPPINPEWNEMIDAITQGLEPVFLGQGSVEEATADIQRDLERVFR